MKIMIEKTGVLKRSIRQILNIIPKNPTLPILKNILLEATGDFLFIEGTDMDTSIRTRIECGVREEGQITVDARKLMTVFQKEKEFCSMSIIADDENITIDLEKSKTKLKGLPASDFPHLEKNLKGVEAKFSGKHLKEMVDKTGFSVSQDRTRLVLTGIYWKVSSNEMVMVSTDGHRLSLFGKKVGIDIEKTVEVVVSYKTFQQVTKMISSGMDLEKVVFGKRAVLFDFGTTTIFSKLIEETYPNFRQVIPQNNSKNIYVSREEFLAILQRLLPLSNSMHRRIHLKIIPNLMEIQVKDEDTGSESTESMNIRYDGELIDITFNCLFLLEILRKIETDEVLLELETSATACIVKPVDKTKPAFCFLETEGESECLYLLMPIRREN